MCVRVHVTARVRVFVCVFVFLVVCIVLACLPTSPIGVGPAVHHAMDGPSDLWKNAQGPPDPGFGIREPDSGGFGVSLSKKGIKTST